FFIDTSNTSIYPLSLHDALPILKSPLIYLDGSHIYEDVSLELPLYWQMLAPHGVLCGDDFHFPEVMKAVREYANVIDKPDGFHEDRKSTRLNSSHVKISYAVFCL